MREKPWHSMTREEKLAVIEKWKHNPAKPWFIQAMADSLKADEHEEPGAAVVAEKP